jgi:hypothetical protein
MALPGSTKSRKRTLNVRKEQIKVRKKGTNEEKRNSYEARMKKYMLKSERNNREGPNKMRRKEASQVCTVLLLVLRIKLPSSGGDIV